MSIHHFCSIQVDFFERQINRYLQIQSERGAEMPTQDEEDDVICHVLDGGSLIQRLPWERDDSVLSTAMLIMFNASVPIPPYCVMVAK